MCLDLRACECVGDKIPLSKLKRYAIRGLAFNLFQSTMNGRSVIEINEVGDNIKSNYGVVKKRVPQGSILVPLLLFCTLMSCK